MVMESSASSKLLPVAKGVLLLFTGQFTEGIHLKNPYAFPALPSNPRGGRRNVQRRIGS